MNFFKTNSYDIVRLYINQIGIAIFSMVLYTASGMIEFDNTNTGIAVKLGVSVFATLFYFLLIYNVTWECGARDKIRIDAGRLSPNKAKGALMSLFANVPNFLVSVIGLVFVSLYLFGAGAWCETAFALFNLIMRFQESMYLGIIQGVTVQQAVGAAPNYYDYLIETILYVVMPILSVLVCHIGYTMGVKEKRIFAFRQGKDKTK